jgi:hypothetical protein
MSKKHELPMLNRSLGVLIQLTPVQVRRRRALTRLIATASSH